MRFPGFIGASYQTRSKNVDCERCINLYPEKTEAGMGKEGEQYALLSTPGLITLATLAAAGPLRGLFTATNGQLFAVSGNKFYFIASDFTATEKGTLTTSSGQVSMDDNGIVVALVDGSTHGYAYNLGSATLTEIEDEDFPGADVVQFVDGYFLFNRPDSGQYFISANYGIDFDALDFATAEGSPDQLVTLIANKRDVWLLGDESIEIHYNSGDADFPFQRIQGAYLDVGCGARYSVARNEDTVFWLGGGKNGSGIIYMAQGYQPVRISTHAVEQAIQSYADVSDAIGFCYQIEGHKFYWLNFPTANTSWVYDTVTGLWHERTYNNQGVIERHRANCHEYAYGKHVVGDYANGKIYELSATAYSDDGVPIQRIRVTPHITGSTARVFYKRFELDIETGVGIDGTGQGEDPQVMLKFSDDHGHSWSSEKWRSFGRIGKRKQRPIWNRLGCSRDRVFHVMISDPVPVTLIGADIEVEKGAS